MDLNFTKLVDYNKQVTFVIKGKFYIFIAILLAVLCALYFLIFYLNFSNGVNKNIVSLNENILNSSNSSIFLKFSNYDFYPVNDKGVYSFWNVCIESFKNPRKQEKQTFEHKSVYYETHRIVVYNSFYREGQQEVHVSGSSNSHSNMWDVLFLRGTIPPSYKFYPVTAFFIVPTCPANFHHFWIDEFVPLYTVIKQGNRLKPNSNNRLFYRQPMDLEERVIKDCTNKTTFEDFLKSLYIKFPHEVFYKVPFNSCFSSGVFGTTSATLSSPREIVEHVLKFFSDNHLTQTLSNANCSVLFLDRRTRQMINVERLVNVVKSVGFASVCRIMFEGLSVKQQLLYTSQARVMIGVQGAGLQWASFMPPGSHLVEIAWPQKHWGFYFQNYVTPYHIRHHRIVARHIQPNWTTYENQVRGGKKIKVEERLSLLNQKWNGNNFDSVWKWADVIVDEEDLKDLMASLAMDL